MMSFTSFSTCHSPASAVGSWHPLLLWPSRSSLAFNPSSWFLLWQWRGVNAVLLMASFLQARWLFCLSRLGFRKFHVICRLKWEEISLAIYIRTNSPNYVLRVLCPLRFAFVFLNLWDSAETFCPLNSCLRHCGKAVYRRCRCLSDKQNSGWGARRLPLCCLLVNNVKFWY